MARPKRSTRGCHKGLPKWGNACLWWGQTSMTIGYATERRSSKLSLWAINQVLVALLGGLLSGGAQAASLAPPFVGCPADGMSGPTPPPASPLIPIAHTDQLALYAAAGMNVLAPRGWHCIEMYGSGGAMLLVTPHLYTADTLPGFKTLVGPAVEVLFLSGENSGRDQVAEVFSRLFPLKHQFVHETAEISEPARRYPTGPFPTDSTVRRSYTEVDYTTPPHHEGMGTFSSRLRPDDAAIVGTATLARSNGVDSVVLVNVRLLPRLRSLVPDILAAAGTARVGSEPGIAR